MKRSLIVVALAVLGLAGNVAVAEPTLSMYAEETARMNAPEATSYQASSKDEQQVVFTWNP